MANESPRAPLRLPTAGPHYQYCPMPSVEVPPPIGGPDHELSLNVHSLGAGFTGPDCGPAVNHARPSYPPSRYTMGNGYPPHPATGFAEYPSRGDQSCRGGHSTPGIAQYTMNPMVPGPPSLGHYAPLAPPQEIPNDGYPSRMPLPHNVVEPSRGNPSPAHTGIATEDLKRLASYYLHIPSSYVDKLRMRRSRSGGYKILILLEVDDTM
ncbi:hypothetical protein BJV74DRAFT_490949 [Russula compacta]|nr:hypothetical protein BJV74DRAFT_490949 [Russula compacta]